MTLCCIIGTVFTCVIVSGYRTNVRQHIRHRLSVADGNVHNSTRCNMVCTEWHQCIMMMVNDTQSAYHRWQPVITIMKQPLLSWRQLITLQGRQRACDAMILPRSAASSILLRFGTRTFSIGITRAVTPPLPPFPPLPLLPLPHIHGARNRGNNNNNAASNDVRGLLSQLPRYDSLLSLWRQRQRSLRLRLTLFDHTHALSLSICLLTIIQWYRRRQRHTLLLPISIAAPISWSSWRTSVIQLGSYITGVALLDLMMHVPSMSRSLAVAPPVPSIAPIAHDDNNNPQLIHLREPLPHDHSDEKRSSSPAPSSRLTRLQHRVHDWHRMITEWRSRLRYHIRTHDRIAMKDMIVQLMNDSMAGIICEIRHRFVMITIFIMGTSMLRNSLRLLVLVDGLRLILKGITPLLPTLAIMRSLIRGPHRGTALTTWFGGLNRGNLLLSLRSLLIGLTITLKRPHWPHLFTTFIDTIILPTFNNITFGSLMIPLRAATTAATTATTATVTDAMMNPLLLHTIVQPSMTPGMIPINETIISSALSSPSLVVSSSQQYQSASLSSRRVFAVSLMMAMCYYRHPLSLSSYLRPLVRRIRPAAAAPAPMAAAAPAVADNAAPIAAAAAGVAAGAININNNPAAAAAGNGHDLHDHDAYERRRVVSHGMYIMHSWCMALFMWRLTLRFGLRYAAITHCTANVIATIARQIICRVMTL